MANSGFKPFGNSGLLRATFDTSGAVNLGNSFGTSRIGSWRLQFVPGGADPGSFTIQERLHGSELSGANWLDLIFYDDATTTVQAAGASVVGASGAQLITVVADRVDIQLTYTAGADGCTVYAAPLLG